MRNVCAKRQTNQRETDLFMKEIRILNELKCENVVKVEGFCSQPLAVMLEYPYFDFKPLCTQYLSCRYAVAEVISFAIIF